MSGLPPVYVVLDGLSAILTLGVAAGFLWLARMSRQGLHFLLSTGFILVAAGFLFVSVSHFGPGITDATDAVRIVCQLTGSSLLFLAYLAHHRTQKSHILGVVFSAVGATIALGVILWLAPGTTAIAPLGDYFAVAYAVMALAYLGCALLSGYGWHKRPTWGRAMVPLGFLCWTFSMYTWIFISLGMEDEFLPVVYVWRFSAILLMLWAMVRKPRFRAARSPLDAA